MTSKISLKQRIDITSRGYKLVEKYCPGLIKGKALLTFVSTIQPFSNIWFTAQVINEISSQKRINHIIFHIVMIIVINFIFHMIKNILDKICSEKEAQMWTFFGKIFSDKMISMDYVDLENAKIQHQRSKEEENLYMFGNGLAQLVWGTSGLVEAFVNILVSITMLVTLFASKAGLYVIDNPVWIIVLLICIFIGGVCNSKAFVKENEVFEDWCKGTVWFNRVFKFYGWNLYSDLERAKDLRIYEQNHIADRILCGLSKKDNEDDSYIFKMSMYQALACIIIGISNAVSYLYVVLKSFYGAFGVGNIVQYVGALSRLGDGVQGLMFVISDNEVYCKHLYNLFDFLDIPNKKHQGSLTIKKSEDKDYQIEFKDVSFKYPGNENYALKNINLKIENGKRLAVVGMNGSGKTTLIKLLCRLYDPTDGVITLDGIDIKEYDYINYMSILSVVFQDFKLFSFGLGQNVACSVQYDKTEVESCLREVGFGERLKDLPKGVETCLYKEFEKDGVEISGGEAQKIAMARAIYKNAPFIILDEPTAALDPIAEYEIYSRFNEIVDNKTTIYISHRLSSCRFCDEIVVFHEGELIQHGSHDTLLSDISGKYYELWNAQAQYYQA